MDELYEQKQRLHKLVEEADDAAKLYAAAAALQSESFVLTPEQEADLDEAIKEADAGQMVPAEVVLAELRAKIDAAFSDKH